VKKIESDPALPDASAWGWGPARCHDRSSSEEQIAIRQREASENTGEAGAGGYRSRETRDVPVWSGGEQDLQTPTRRPRAIWLAAHPQTTGSIEARA